MTSRCQDAALACSVIAVAAGPAAQEIAAPDQFLETRRLLQRAIDDGDLPGASIVVLRGGKTVWAEGFGMADVATRRPATPETVYPVGRLSEVLTATGLMILVDRDVLELDTLLNDALPGAKLRFPASDADSVTIEAVMGHAAGLPVHWSFYDADERVPALEETLRAFGVTASYAEWPRPTNIGYVALARVVEHATEQPWDRFLRQELFAHLGLRATGLAPDESKAATLYRREVSGGFSPVAPAKSSNPAAYGFWSSASDQARFLLLHLQDGAVGGERILNENLTRRMRTAIDRKDGRGRGIGWRIGPWPKPEYIYLDELPGFVRGYPDADDGFVLLTNGAPRALRAVQQQLIADLGYEEGADWRQPLRPGGNRGAPPMDGTWRGAVQLENGALKVVLDIGVHATTLSAGGQTVRSLDTRVSSSRLWATFTPDGHLPGTEFRAVPSWRFDLRRIGDALDGIAYAVAEDRFTLPHLVELRRAQ